MTVDTPVAIRCSNPAKFIEKINQTIILKWRGHPVAMEKGDVKLPPWTCGPLYSTGKRVTISVSKTPRDSKKIPCAVGAQNLRVCATIGEDGKDPIRKIRLSLARRKSPFKVTIQLILCFETFYRRFLLNFHWFWVICYINLFVFLCPFRVSVSNLCKFCVFWFGHTCIQISMYKYKEQVLWSHLPLSGLSS